MQSPIDEEDDKSLPKRPKEPLKGNLLSPLLGLVALGFACFIILRYEPVSFSDEQIAYSGLPPEMQARVVALNQTVNELHRDLSALQQQRDGVSTGALTVEPGHNGQEPPSESELFRLSHSLDSLAKTLDDLKHKER